MKFSLLQKKSHGFTLMELIIVITILAIVAAVVIPTFQNMDRHAKNASVKGTVNALRAALMMYRMNEISSGRSTGESQGAIAGWPPGDLVRDIQDGGSISGHVLDSGDIPDNPYAEEAGIADFDSVEWWFNCAVSLPGGSIVGNGAWVYDQCDGRFWANTNVNNGVQTENYF